MRATADYWREQQRLGALGNSWIEPEFTTFFGLDRPFYEGKRVLDVGCGPRGTLEWATMARERVGIDPLVPFYRRELDIAGHAMTYVEGYAEQLPFERARFDVVTSFNALDHVNDLDAAIAEVKRVVAPGGLFLLITEVVHRARLFEPQDYSWDVVDRFEPELELVWQTHLEHGENVHSSVLIEAVPYDHSRLERRPGVLAAKFRRRD